MVEISAHDTRDDLLHINLHIEPSPTEDAIDSTSEVFVEDRSDESDTSMGNSEVVGGIGRRPSNPCHTLYPEKTDSFYSFSSVEESSAHDGHVCSESAVAGAYEAVVPSLIAHPTPHNIAVMAPSLQLRFPLMRPLVHPQQSNSTPWSNLIDNSRRAYISFRLKCGVSVQVGENVLDDCPNILEHLNHDLICCLHVLPASVRRLVKRTKIWINRTYSYGPVCDPKIVNHTTAHHYATWLMCVRDNPQKEESIEIYNAAEYLKMRLHYNGCGLILHELCHIIHQKTLPGGLNNAMVIEIHKKAQESRKYARVLRRDWALREIDTDMAYCIVNHKEFFAEISVTYLADYYHDVDGVGTTDMSKCSPPFVAPTVIERIRQRAIEEQTGKHQLDGRQIMAASSKYKVIAMADNMVLPHCNKFFPFTKGQLRRYDPRVFKCFAKLWQFIESWEDREGRLCGKCSSFDWC